MKTEMMMTRKIIIPILIALLSTDTFSQDSDFGIWFGTTVKHELLRNIDIEATGSLRTSNNTTSIDQYFLQAGGRYSINRHFSAGADYRLIKKQEDNEDYYFRHKYFFDLTATIPVGNLSLSGRAMYQITNKTYIENDNDLIAENTIRFRLKSRYTLQSTPLKPYIEYEAFMQLNEGSDFGISKFRLSGGAEIRITQRSNLDLSYIYERRSNSANSIMNIINLGYNFEF